MVGVPTSTGIITTLQNFQQQLNNIFSQSNYRNAVPIQYSLTDLGEELGPAIDAIARVGSKIKRKLSTSGRY